MPQDITNSETLTFVVVDDHESVLGGTIAALERQYPGATMVTAQTAQAAATEIATRQPNLVVMDLSIPETPKDTAQTDVGLRLLKTLIEQYPTLNIVVQSTHVRSLIRLKPTLDLHQGGLTVADKSLPVKEMLIKVDWALQGLFFTPREMRAGLEIREEWLNVLELAFQEGLQDKAIAQRMSVAERTVRHYWTKAQDALGVYPEPGKNSRIQTEIRAREEGLID